MKAVTTGHYDVACFGCSRRGGPSRYFPLAAARLCSLPHDIVLADSLSTYRRRLKHYLFQKTYPDVVL